MKRLQSGQSLRIKLLAVPVGALLSVLVISAFVISQRVNRALISNEDSQIAQMSTMLWELHQNQMRAMATAMKVAVSQGQLYDGYFEWLTEDNFAPLRRFVEQTKKAAQVDDILVVQDAGTVLVRAASEKRGDVTPFAQLLEPVLSHGPIVDKQEQLDDVIVTRLLNDDGSFRLLTVGPVLDVETVVGALVFVKKIDLRNLASLKKFFPENAEVSIAAADRVAASTLGSWSLPVDLGAEGTSFDLAVNGRPFRHRFVPLECGPGFLGLSYDVSENEAARSSVGTIMAVIFLAALALLVFIILFNVSRIIRSVDTLARHAERISRGDLTAHVEDLGGDEIGRMAQAYGGMAVNLRGIIGQAVALSADLAEAAENLSVTSTQIASNNEEVSREAKRLASASVDMNSDMTTTAQSVGEVSERIAAIATAAEQMNVTVENISDNAHAASKVSAVAVSKAEEASARVGKLSGAAEQISSITQAIADISEQTKLLALNATIEAARAGDVGKGFAVVAGEVKELARQSASAAEDIAERNRVIQKSLAGAMGVIEQITDVIADVNERVSQISEAVREQSASTGHIAGNVSQASTETRQIAQSTDRLSENISGLDANIGQIAERMAENTSSVGDIARTSTSLVEKAEALKSLTERFQT